MNTTIRIPRQFRDALPSVMAANGFRTIIVDRCPRPAGVATTQQRYICGYRVNAVLVTIKISQLDPDMTWAMVGCDFWLLARYGKITFDYVIVQTVIATLAGAAWLVEHAESESEMYDVEQMLRGIKPRSLNQEDRTTSQC